MGNFVKHNIDPGVDVQVIIKEGEDMKFVPISAQMPFPWPVK